MSFSSEISPQDAIQYLKCLAGKIATGQTKNIITLAGAGISTSAGIPDFRSPRTGLLFRSSDPKEQSVDLVAWNKNFFLDRPEVLFKILRNNFFPQERVIQPTLTHCFIRLLEAKGSLLRHFTQNIDGLEIITGMTPDKVVEAHGSLHRSYCTGCRTRYDFKWMTKKIRNSTVPCCDSCGGFVRPDIVLFGEELSGNYELRSFIDLPRCDMLLVLGTSLTVEPFASLVQDIPPQCPRIVICKNLGTELQNINIQASSFRSHSSRNELHEGVEFLLPGECDTFVQELVRLIGWDKDFEDIIEKVQLKLFYGNIVNFDVGVQVSPPRRDLEGTKEEGRGKKSTIATIAFRSSQQPPRPNRKPIRRSQTDRANDRFCNYCYHNTC